MARTKQTSRQERTVEIEDKDLDEVEKPIGKKEDEEPDQVEKPSVEKKDEEQDKVEAAESDKPTSDEQKVEEDSSVKELRAENIALRKKLDMMGESLKKVEEEIKTLREEVDHMKSVVALQGYTMDEDKAARKRSRKE